MAAEGVIFLLDSMNNRVSIKVHFMTVGLKNKHRGC